MNNGGWLEPMTLGVISNPKRFYDSRTSCFPLLNSSKCRAHWFSDVHRAKSRAYRYKIQDRKI